MAGRPRTMARRMQQILRRLPILSRIEAGDSTATEHLLRLVYDELKRLAAQRLTHEKPGQTLRATALLHEAYLRVVDGEMDIRHLGTDTARARVAHRGRISHHLSVVRPIPTSTYPCT